MAKRRASERDIVLPDPKSPQRRERCLADPCKFMREYFPVVFFNPFTPTQEEMVAHVCDVAQYGLQKARADARGGGKTKICEGLSIYATCKEWVDFVSPLAANGKFANRILENVKKLLQADRFAEDFPEIGYLIKLLGNEPRRATSQTVGNVPTNITWKKEYIVLPTVAGTLAKGQIFYPYSIEGGIRGLCIGEKRPNLIIIDDPETRESARSDMQIALREQIIEEDVSGLKGPDNKLGIVALVTIQNERCLAARLTDIKLKPAWGGVRRSLIEAWPKRRDLWDEYCAIRKRTQETGDPFAWEATEFYILNRDAMDDGAIITNQYRFNGMKSPAGNPIEISALQGAWNFICDKGMDSFACEYQNAPNGTDQHVKQFDLTSRAVEERVGIHDRLQVFPGLLGVTMGLDIGKYWCHWTKIAWYPHEDGTYGQIIDYGILSVHDVNPSSPKEAVEKALRKSLDSFHAAQAAMELGPDFTLVDSSDGLLKDVIYSFVRECPELPQFAASKGFGDNQGPKEKFGPHESQPERIMGDHWYAQLQSKDGVWLYHPDANFWKRWVHERFSTAPIINNTIAGNVLSLFIPTQPRQHLQFSKHILAEEWRETFVPGRGTVAKFVQVSASNHHLDATYMACAAAAMRGWINVSGLQ